MLKNYYITELFCAVLVAVLQEGSVELILLKSFARIPPGLEGINYKMGKIRSFLWSIGGL